MEDFDGTSLSGLVETERIDVMTTRIAEIKRGVYVIVKEWLLKVNQSSRR